VPSLYSSPDLLPGLSVVYVCRCGRRLGAYGVHAGTPPPRWQQLAEDEYACEHCVSRAEGAESRETSEAAN
jgi:DNA-directed RNA polymerase subunit RPC12/RpoP